MKKIINNYLIFSFLFISIAFGSEKVFLPLSLGGSVSIGYDSNPLRLSENEISELDSRPYILDKANNVYSRFFNFNTQFKFYSKRTLLSYMFDNRKTIFNVGHSYKMYIDNTKKSRSSYSFKIDQQLGDYKHIYIDYFLMPNFYLREYEDLDYDIPPGIYFNQNIEQDIEQIIQEAKYRSSFFDIEKITISFQRLIGESSNKLKLGLFNEMQLFDKYFTEFDLDIKGSFIQFSFYSYDHNYFTDKRSIIIYFESQKADNYTYLDGSYSTSFMDRSYDQSRYKCSFSQNIKKGKSFGFIIDMFERKNTSNLSGDKLHYMRKHSDTTLSFWYKRDKHKFMLSTRNRNTTSPYEWVEDLKTFDRVIFTYTYTLDKIKYN